MFKVDENLKKDVLIAMLESMFIKKENSNLKSIEDYVNKNSTKYINKQNILRALFELIIEHKVESHIVNNKYKYVLKIPYTKEVSKLYKEKYGTSFELEQLVKDNTFVELENEILMRIYERTLLKKKECSFKNIALPLVRNNEEVDDFFFNAKQAMFGLLMKNKIQSNNHATYELNPEIVDTVKEKYDKSIKEHYKKLTSAQKFLLNEICFEIEKNQAFSLDYFDKNEMQTIMKNFTELCENGFAIYRNAFFNFETKYEGKSFAPTYFGIIANERFYKNKYNEKQNTKEI